LTLTEDGDFAFDKGFKGFVVSGVVNTPENTPGQRSAVSLSIAHLNNESPEYAQWLRGRTNANADGVFKFDDVATGTYVITASLEGVAQASSQITINAAGPTGL